VDDSKLSASIHFTTLRMRSFGLIYHAHGEKQMAGKKNTIVAAAIIAMSASAGTVQAEDGESMFKLTGFGTVGIAHSSIPDADFVSNYWVQPAGVGKTHAWSSTIDSRIGAQINAKLANNLSAVVQMVSEQRWDNSYRPFVEWANLKYDVTPDFSVRVGRVLLPTYMWSESRKVGYTNPWIRPPVELYDQLSVTNNDGIDATYRFTLGGVRNSASILYGKTELKISSGADAKLKHSTSISDTVEYGNLMAHFAYQQMKMDMPSLAGFNALGCKRCESDVPLKVAATGFSYDVTDWFLMAEWSRIWLNKEAFAIDGVQTSAYLTGGMRFGAYTPYLTYGEIKQTVGSTVFPPTAQKSVSLGLRWDFMSNTDLKLQYDRIRPGAGSSGFFTKTSGTAGGNVISAAIDFVF